MSIQGRATFSENITAKGEKTSCSLPTRPWSGGVSQNKSESHGRVIRESTQEHLRTFLSSGDSSWFRNGLVCYCNPLCSPTWLQLLGIWFSKGEGTSAKMSPVVIDMQTLLFLYGHMGGTHFAAKPHSVPGIVLRGFSSGIVLCAIVRFKGLKTLNFLCPSSTVVVYPYVSA